MSGAVTRLKLNSPDTFRAPKSKPTAIASYGRYMGIFAAQKRAGCTLPWSSLESHQGVHNPFFRLDLLAFSIRARARSRSAAGAARRERLRRAAALQPR